MNRVGPATKTMRASTTARTMLMLDNHWMPRLIPEMAEATKHTVRMATIPTSTGVPSSPVQPLEARPLPICSAPRPSEAAVPKRVAKIARILMNFPAGPSTALTPKSEVKAAEISCRRPSRYVP